MINHAMITDSAIALPATDVRSLCWYGDGLIDWVSGAVYYGLDGSVREKSVDYPYRFDAAVMSPSLEYAAIYERLGTKGILVKAGEIVREINRSYFWAHAYEYPVALFTLPDGRELIAHCPNAYNRLEIEDIVTGKQLTKRDDEMTIDFFHSRLAVDPQAKWLLSAGWVWHPFDTVETYDIEMALLHPESLDEWNRHSAGFGSEVDSAAFLDSTRLVVASAHDAGNFKEDPPGSLLKPGTIGVYDLESHQYLSIAPTEETVGTMMPAGTEHVIGFYEYPKLIHLESGSIVYRWPDLVTGTQNSSILKPDETPPPLARDPTNRRFAVAGEEEIIVVTIGGLEQ